MSDLQPATPGQDWYILAGNSIAGPHTADALVQMLRDGKVAAQAQFSSGQGWISAQAFLAAVGIPTSEPAASAPAAAPQADPPEGEEAIAALAALEPQAAPEVDDSVPIRDRIVIIGRRQAGKTIYLASIYAKLWKSTDTMIAKALSGEAHKQLMGVHDMLLSGKWPPSTLGTTQMELEVTYHGKKRLLVALDFAGELFGKAFVDEKSDWPGVRELVDHIDHAAAVLLLVDPYVVAGRDKRAVMEDDFGLVQAVQRIRNWPGGDRVPVVMVLTKMDQHQALLDRFGGAAKFVRNFFPALLRTAQELPIMQISAVQTELDPAGQPRPRADSIPVNVDGPIRFCLLALDRDEQEARHRANQEQRRAAQAARAAQLRRAEAQRNRQLKFAIGLTAACGSALVALIIYLRL